mmetsp:Transcript_8491/g.10232  ORF Transcript_8491/g.10232 Transcript_8491/m.10232 type:complete len:143 (-) Transcript_8491:38-466(-)
MAQTPGQNMMEIKGDVAHRLEANGALDQIRAQMRASVYRALLGDQDSSDMSPQEDSNVEEAPVPMVSLVTDFLEHSDLSMTKEVFLRETSQKPLPRDDLVNELKTLEMPKANQAVLEQVLVAARQIKRSGVPEAIPEDCERV